MNLEDLSKEELIKIINGLQRDSLTGFYRREIIANLSKPYYIVGMIDINGLKKVNDRLGHLAGDALILQVTKDINKCIRKNDTVIRYGGDEFIIIFDNCTAKCARTAMQRIKHVSYGVGKSYFFERALELADADMYEHKQKYYRVD